MAYMGSYLVSGGSDSCAMRKGWRQGPGKLLGWFAAVTLQYFDSLAFDECCETALQAYRIR